MTWAGKILRINRSDIASFTAPASPMPPMADLLNTSELRDLVAWIATLNKSDGTTLPAVVPQPLDPNTLEIPKKSATTAGIDPAFLKTGQQQFLVCGACHGQGGEGTAIAPPIAGSEWVNGPAENLIRIQLRGLQGPIKVKGQEYNLPAGMAALAYQTDEQIAAVLTYIRTSFGNSAPAVTPAEVTALRGEVGKPQITAAELVPPTAATTREKPDATAPATVKAGPGKYEKLAPAAGINKWWIALVGVIALIAAFLFLKRK